MQPPRRRALLAALAAIVAAHTVLSAQSDRASDAAAQAGVDNAPLDLSVGSPNVTLLSHGLLAEPDTDAVLPDASGDVGPTQYLLAANGRIRTFAKATGVADGALNATTDLFFSTVRDGAATTAPRVRFDRRAGRWLVLMRTVALPNRYLLAVSHSATAATGAWTFHQWENERKQGGVGLAAACVGDDPTLALDEDAIYIGVNQRCGATLVTLSFDSTTLYVLRRSSVLAGSITDRTAFDGLVATPGSPGIYAPQGVTNFDDNTAQGYVIGVDNLDKDRLVLRKISNPGGTPTLLPEIVVTTDVDPTGDPIDVPHQGGVLPLDGLDHRLGQAVIRNGRLWTSHHFEVDSFGEADPNGNRNGVRWYELTALTATPQQAQSGTVWDPAGANPASYWLGSIMPNGQGHVALGMSTAGTLRRVNAAVTGRLAGDPIGTMDAPAIYGPAHAFTYNLQSAPLTRQAWNRVSSTSLDPDDDMTLWTLQQFVDGFDSWGLQLVRIQAPPPATIAAVSPNTLASGLTGASLAVTGTSSSGSGFFDPGPGFLRRLAASFSGAGVTVTGVTYSSPTSLTLTVNTVGAAAGARTLTVTNPDGQVAQRASALTITTAPANLAPVAANDAAGTPFGTLLNVQAPGVLANDVDPEGQPLTAQLVATTAHGSLTLSANGAVIYVPVGRFHRRRLVHLPRLRRREPEQRRHGDHHRRLEPRAGLHRRAGQSHALRSGYRRVVGADPLQRERPRWQRGVGDRVVVEHGGRAGRGPRSRLRLHHRFYGRCDHPGRIDDYAHRFGRLAHRGGHLHGHRDGLHRAWGAAESRRRGVAQLGVPHLAGAGVVVRRAGADLRPRSRWRPGSDPVQNPARQRAGLQRHRARRDLLRPDPRRDPRRLESGLERGADCLGPGRGAAAAAGPAGHRAGHGRDAAVDREPARPGDRQLSGSGGHGVRAGGHRRDTGVGGGTHALGERPAGYLLRTPGGAERGRPEPGVE